MRPMPIVSLADGRCFFTKSSARTCMSQGNKLNMVKKGNPSADVLR